LRLIETSDLSAIHNLHLVETDEFNTLGIPEDIMRIESWITSNKEKNKELYLCY
jgi:hypothetical protein